MNGRAYKQYILFKPKMNGRACKQYIFRSYDTSTVNAMRFEENPFTCQSENENEKA